MRKLSGLVMLLLLSVVLVSCTVGEDEEPEPADVPTLPPASTTISEEEENTDVGIEGTPEIDPEEGDTPSEAVSSISTPVMAGDATPEASPVGAEASPAADDEAPVDAVATPAEVLMATPEEIVMPPLEATPVATPRADATPMASPAGEETGMVVPPAPEPTPTPVRIEMTGTIMLGGEVNETYVITDEGCVGLGEYDDLHEDRQVVIRNQDGTIVSVTTLEAATDADGCAWEFVASVPESEFYSVSIPMVFEQVFPKAQVAENNGEVTIELP